MSDARFAGVLGGVVGFLAWTVGLVGLVEAAFPGAHLRGGRYVPLLAVGAIVVGGLIGVAATR